MKPIFTLRVFLLFCFRLSAQQPGTLDPSFGRKGIVRSPLTSYYSGEQVAIAGNGTLYVGTLGSYRGFNFTFRLDALLPDGSVDSSFGQGGSAYALFPGMTDTMNINNTAAIISLAVLPDGKMITCGTMTFSNGYDSRIALARFQQNGTLDSSFGVNGSDTFSFGYPRMGAGAVTVQPDGKLIIGGFMIINDEKNLSKCYTARFLTDGKIDSSYGKNGLALSKSPGAILSTVMQKDGKIVAAGYSGRFFHLERYDAYGNPDVAFGSNGVVDTKPSKGFAVINDVTMQDDRIVVTGYSSHPLRMTTARYTAKGSLDVSFGGGGIVTTSLPKFSGAGLSYRVYITGERKDKIVVSGCNCEFVNGRGDFTAIGYRTDGTLDSAFGKEGLQIINVDDGDYATGGAMQKDGKIVAIGYSYSLNTFEENRLLTRSYGYMQKVPLYIKVKRGLQNHTLSVYPNPARDYIIVKGLPVNETASVCVADAAGNVKARGISTGTQYRLQIANLHTGTYYLQVVIGTDIKRIPFIKE